MPEEPLTPESRWARLFKAAERRGVPLRSILATVAVVILAYLAGKVIYRIRDVLLIMVVAGFIAIILNPVVLALERWHIARRGWAVAVVTLLALIIFVALAAAFGYPLVNGLTHLADRLPLYVKKAEQGKGWIGHVARHYHVDTWVQRNAPKLTSFAKNLAKPALSLGKGAVTLVITMFTVFVLVLLFLLEGPKLRTGFLSLVAPRRAATYTRVAGEVSRSVTGFVLGDLMTSLTAGIVVFATLMVLGVPFPLLWALWVALVDFLPVIGGALAGIPTVLFALGHSLTAGLVTLIVFLVYTQIENHVLNPVVMSRTVKVNPLLVLVSILVGASLGSWIGGFFGGFVAALLAIPIAGATQVVVRELWNDTATTEPPQIATTAGEPPL
jgi:predicted PurR-regulated permease PerM